MYNGRKTIVVVVVAAVAVAVVLAVLKDKGFLVLDTERWARS